MADFAVALVLIAAGVLSRIIPHPPNFTAVSALALFASFYLGNWKLGPAVTLVTLITSDLVVGTYEPQLMASVYAASLIPLILGRNLRGRLLPGRLAACSLGSSIAFFLTTNFAVWLFGNWYASDWGGLVACFAAGVPFFRYTLSSDLVFSCVLFGGYALAVHRAGIAFSARAVWAATRRVAERGNVCLRCEPWAAR
jgi:hypothetical protein